MYAQLSVETVGNGDWRHIDVAPYQKCTDLSHFEKFFQDAVDKGAEGVILRDSAAHYIAGRSRGYLKHKVSPFKPNTSGAKISSLQEISRWGSKNNRSCRKSPLGV